MQLILLERIEGLGNVGDEVKVRPGYGRNFLLPKKLAIEATKANKAVIVQMKDAAVRRHQKDKADAEKLAAQLSAAAITITRRAGEHDGERDRTGDGQGLEQRGSGSRYRHRGGTPCLPVPPTGLADGFGRGSRPTAPGREGS